LRGLGNFRVSGKCGRAVLYKGVSGTGVVAIQRSPATVKNAEQRQKAWRIQYSTKTVCTQFIKWPAIETARLTRRTADNAVSAVLANLRSAEPWFAGRVG